MTIYSKRIVGIDFGTRRLGLACSDPLRITAQPLPTITLNQPQEAVPRVLEVLRQHEVELIVLGIPVTLSGDRGGKTVELVEAFAAGLRRAGYLVVLEDERFTSAEAKSAMRAAGQSERQMRGKLDSIAAQVILQDYLDAHYGGQHGNKTDS